MKFTVNESCIGCGMCVSTCPEVFSLTDTGKAQAVDREIPPATESTAEEAQSACPVGAIEKK